MPRNPGLWAGIPLGFATGRGRLNRAGPSQEEQLVADAAVSVSSAQSHRSSIVSTLFLSFLLIRAGQVFAEFFKFYLEGYHRISTARYFRLQLVASF